MKQNFKCEKKLCVGKHDLIHVQIVRFQHILKFKDGATMVEHGNKGKSSVMNNTTECTAWLQCFVNSVGDHQPDNGAIHISAKLTPIKKYA